MSDTVDEETIKVNQISLQNVKQIEENREHFLKLAIWKEVVQLKKALI